VNRLGFLLVSPAILTIGVLVIYPSIRSIIGSLQRYSLTNPRRDFVGLHNYVATLGDSSFEDALRNTAGYFAVITTCVLIIGMLMALWLQSLKGHARAIGLTVVVIPWAVPGIVSGILWSFILNPTGNGLLNSALKSFNLISHYRIWLNEPILGIGLIGLSVAWSAVPLGVVVLLAGLEGIPREIYEQATVDGASRIQQFVKITLPLLRPALALVLLNAAIVSIGVFDQVYALVGLDPNKITLTGQIYLYAFRSFNFGYGFAASVIATIITGGISIVYLKFIYRAQEF